MSPSSSGPFSDSSAITASASFVFLSSAPSPELVSVDPSVLVFIVDDGIAVSSGSCEALDSTAVFDFNVSIASCCFIHCFSQIIDIERCQNC